MSPPDKVYKLTDTELRESSAAVSVPKSSIDATYGAPEITSEYVGMEMSVTETDREEGNSSNISVRVIDGQDIRSMRRSLNILVLVVIGVSLYFAKDIIMPIALGLLITLTLTPLVRFVRRLGVQSGLAAFAVVLLVGSAMGTGGYLLSTPVSDLIDSAPTIGARLQSKLAEFRSSVDTISSVSAQVESIAGEAPAEDVQQVVIKQPGIISSATSSLMSGLTSIALALIFALFMLASGDMFYQKLIAVMPQLSEKKKALRIVYAVEDNVSQYLFTITLINISLGVIITLLLFIAGMPNAPLWGTIAAVMNFLPYVGALLGAGLLAAMSLGNFDTMMAALIPPFLYLTCTTIEGNILTPMIVGKRLELNSVAVFLAVAIWGWLWGIAGALMAVPLLVVFKVLCDHSEDLATWGEFLGGSRSTQA